MPRLTISTIGRRASRQNTGLNDFARNRSIGKITDRTTSAELLQEVERPVQHLALGILHVTGQGDETRMYSHLNSPGEALAHEYEIAIPSPDFEH